jgi:hypothetical protein
VAKLQGDSDTPPSLVPLIGYFGPSKKEGSIRLYPTLDFQSYFELPKSAIVATTPVDAKDDTSPTIVHVKAGTHVEAVQTTTVPVESYLQGGITKAFTPDDNGSEPLPWAILHPTTTMLPTLLRCTQVGCTHLGCPQPTTTVLPTRLPLFCPPSHAPVFCPPDNTLLFCPVTRSGACAQVKEADIVRTNIACTLTNIYLCHTRHECPLPTLAGFTC